MCAYILLGQMTTIVMAVAAAVMAMLMVSIVAVSTTFAVIDNSTNVSTKGGANESSSVVAENGSSDNGKNAKSGINTTVCGPDAAHACQTSSGGQ
jgi:uncharacterized membrane protein